MFHFPNRKSIIWEVHREYVQFLFIQELSGHTCLMIVKFLLKSWWYTITFPEWIQGKVDTKPFKNPVNCPLNHSIDTNWIRYLGSEGAEMTSGGIDTCEDSQVAKFRVLQMPNPREFAWDVNVNQERRYDPKFGSTNMGQKKICDMTDDHWRFQPKSLHSFGGPSPAVAHVFCHHPAASSLRPLNNLVVLFTAFTAFFYLKTRFKMVHYAGSLSGWWEGIVVDVCGTYHLQIPQSFLASKELSIPSGKLR